MAWTTTGVSQHETAGSLLPVAPSTRLVASTYQRRTIHDTSQVATAQKPGLTWVPRGRPIGPAQGQVNTCPSRRPAYGRPPQVKPGVATTG